MTFVTSMMTTKELSDDDIEKTVKIITSKFNNTVKISKYNYDDRQYYEVDIDLLDVDFSKESIYHDINKLISAYEEIMDAVSLEIDFIAANDDTDTEILRYENNANDIKDFGLFVTNRNIPNIRPYYSSKICNAYVNLTHVSFGAYF
ncbi:MAG TPA: hypothetical protein DEF04_09645 [Clostridiales bacterium]|nr:hypothetical protein [Clostridiales bacterium]